MQGISYWYQKPMVNLSINFFVPKIINKIAQEEGTGMLQWL